MRLLAGARTGHSTVSRACSVWGTELTINGAHWMNTETAEQPSPAEAATSVDTIADLEVDLHFELQVLSTPLAELAAMRPGYVIELPVAAADAVVSLVVNGQVLGRAQLVSVGDRLGARILELAHADR
jgi:type III secretion protein Q